MPTTTGIIRSKEFVAVAGAVEKWKSFQNRELNPIDWQARRMLLKQQAAEIQRRSSHVLAEKTETA